VLAHATVAGAAIAAQIPVLAADDYPSRRVTIINQFAPGS
jgi:hypothetical protein